MGTLDAENGVFERNRTEWVKHHQGKFVLVKDERLVDVFDSADAAYSAGIQQFGAVPFLVKQVVTVDPIQQAPAYTLGLIHALA